MTDEDQLNKTESDLDDDDNEENIDSNVTTDDEFYSEMMSAPSVEREDYLIHDGCKDEVEGADQLFTGLNRRYDSAPAIFFGTLKEAIKSSWNSKDIHERRPLLIYINNDKSLYSNLFCKQLLCNEKITEFLLNNYVLWAWDVTHPSNGQTLSNIYKQAFFPSSVDKNIGQKPIEQYPLLISVIRQVNGSFAFQNLIQGNEKQPPLDEFLARLIQCKDQFDIYEDNYEKEQIRQANFHMNTHPASILTSPNFSHSMSLFESTNSTRFDRFFSQIDRSGSLAEAFQRSNRITDDDDDDDDYEQTPTVENPAPNFPKE